MATHEVRILNTSIDIPFETAYAFAHLPENFPKWAAGLSSSLHKSNEGWVADTPTGTAVVTFAGRNDFGVLDHRVKVEGQPEVYIPLRMMANGTGTEVELVLYRQPDMTDADFERDAGLVAKDLASLKKVLEASS
jgi:hypothetical protein